MFYSPLQPFLRLVLVGEDDVRRQGLLHRRKVIAERELNRLRSVQLLLLGLSNLRLVQRLLLRLGNLLLGRLLQQYQEIHR